MATITIYTQANCAYCTWAKQLLDVRKVTYEEIRIDEDAEKREEMIKLSGKRTTPQIFINGQSIGGYDDLTQLAKSGELTDLLG